MLLYFIYRTLLHILVCLWLIYIIIVLFMFCVFKFKIFIHLCMHTFLFKNSLHVESKHQYHSKHEVFILMLSTHLSASYVKYCFPCELIILLCWRVSTTWHMCRNEHIINILLFALDFHPELQRYWFELMIWERSLTLSF